MRTVNPSGNVDHRQCYNRGNQRSHALLNVSGRCRQLSDLFISYKREDLERVAAIQQALAGAGLSVWWDREIHGGDKWRLRIQSELEAAKCVLVVWSMSSIGEAADFVIDEANRGKRRGVLVQVRIDDVLPPLGFGEHQILDLIGWKGDLEDQRVEDLIAAVQARVEGGPLLEPGGTSALTRIRKLADGGDGRSMADLGLMYEDGENGLTQDDAQAVKWYQKAADLGDGRGMAYLGLMHGQGRGGLTADPVQAVSWYRKAVDAGDERGMVYLGYMYLFGLGGLPEDESQGAYWFRKAAEAGDQRGMLSLGLMYTRGWDGVPTDESQAVIWFKKAAEAGFGNAMVELGLIYAGGKGGLPKDETEAVIWFRRGAYRGNARGMLYLGVMYACGRGRLPKDGAQAASWYRKAAEEGDACAMVRLALMYEDGRGGLSKDHAQAVALLRKAAKDESYAQRARARGALRRLSLRRLRISLKPLFDHSFIVVTLKVLPSIAILMPLTLILYRESELPDFLEVLIILTLSISPCVAGFGLHNILFRQSRSIGWGARSLYTLATLESLCFFLFSLVASFGGNQSIMVSFLTAFGLGLFISWDRLRKERRMPIGGVEVSIWNWPMDL